jgi:ankyrin repeat protein/serine/threonine protein kinase
MDCTSANRGSSACFIHEELRRGEQYNRISSIIESHPWTAIARNFAGYENISNSITSTLASDNIETCKGSWSSSFYDDQLPLHTAILFESQIETIELLIFSYPDACSKVDRHGRLPLHYVFMTKDIRLSALEESFDDLISTANPQGALPSKNNRTSIDDPKIRIANTLITAYPEACWKGDDNLELPLHFAVASACSQESILLILDCYPEACAMKNNLGQLPIHKAVQSNASPQVVNALINHYTDGLLVQDCNGCLPIHLAACCPSSIEVLSILVKAYPPGCIVRASGKDNALPLHLAIENKLSLDSILVLLDAFKDGCKVKNSMNRLPLHIATIEWCSHSASIVQVLIKVFPLGCLERDSLGGLPLYYALFMKAKSDIVGLILDVYRQHNSDDDLRCLHTALQKKADAEVISMLIEAFPDTGVDIDDVGNMPLHWALITNCSDGIILELISKYPRSLSQAGENGNLPLHLAAEMKCSSQIVITLLDLYSGACKLSNSNGDLPLHCALRSGLSRSSIMSIFSVYPGACAIRNNVGEYPLHILLAHQQFPMEFQSDFHDGSTLNCESSRHVRVDRLPINNTFDSMTCQDANGKPDGSLTAHDIKSLVDAFPHAVSKFSEFSELLPVHLAAKHNFPADILALIIEAYPDGIKTKSGKGAYAFHFSCVSRFPSLKILELLYAKFPEAVESSLPTGKLPLHLTLQHDQREPDVAFQPVKRIRQLPGVEANSTGESVSSLVDIVNFLLYVNAAAARHRDNDGNLPIHLAINNSYSLEIILSLIGTYIQGIKVKTHEGSLCIHSAAKSCRSVDVINDLLRFYPDGYKCADAHGDYPVHVALRHNECDEVVIYLIKESMDVCELPGANEETAFFIATKNKRSIQVLSAILNVSQNIKFTQYPHENISYANDSETSPEVGFRLSYLLHIALQSGCGIEEIKLLLNENASLSSESYKFGSERYTYLLHTAVKYSNNVELIHFLIDINPHICLKQNSEGMAPLEVAIENGASNTVVSTLLRAHPVSSRGYLSHSNDVSDIKPLPLHRALFQKSCDDTIRLLIQMFPKACGIKYREQYPLQIALCKSLSTDIILLILKTFPDASLVLDTLGRTPLHLAIIHQSSFNVIETLLEHDPSSCLKHDRTFDCLTPFDYAVKVNASSDVKKLLLLHDLPIQLIGDANGSNSMSRNSGFTWVSFIDTRNKVLPLEDMISFITFLFEHLCSSNEEQSIPIRQSSVKYNEHNCWGDLDTIKLLCTATDREGKAAIDIADAKVKEVMYHYLYFYGRFKLALGPPRYSSRSSCIISADDFGVCEEYRNVYDNYCSIFSGKSMRFEGFEKSVKAVANHFDRLQPSQDTLLLYFQQCDVNNDRCLSKSQFEYFCRRYFGESRSVILKFIRSRDHYRREKRLRGKLREEKLRNELVIPILGDLDSAKLQDSFKCRFDGGELHLDKYHCCLVMTAGDRSLFDIYIHENPSFDDTIRYFENILECVEHIHSRGIIHGNLKLNKFIRRNNRLHLIDFGAATSFATRNGTSYIGFKFSSGILPPEMFYEFKSKYEVEEYSKYWNIAERAADDFECVSRYTPFYDLTTKKSYAVRTYDIDGESDQPRDIDKLPYEVIFACEQSQKIDSWMIGILFYFILTKENFLSVDLHQDLDRNHIRSSMHILKGHGNRERIVQRIDHSLSLRDLPGYCKELLKFLLDPSPDSRISVSSAKNFLLKSRADDNKLSELKGVLITSRTQKLQKKLQAFINEGKCFVVAKNEKSKILKKKTYILANLPDDVISKASMISNHLKLNNPSSASSFPNVFVITNQLLRTDSSEMIHDEKIVRVDRARESFLRWLALLSELTENVVNYNLNQSECGNVIADILAEKYIYFYLIDEISLEPVLIPDDDPYPLKVKEEVLLKVLPLYICNLQVLSKLSTIHQIGKLLGNPSATLSDEERSLINSILSYSQSKDLTSAEISQVYRIVESICEQYSFGSSNYSSDHKLNERAFVKGIKALEGILLNYDPYYRFSGMKRISTSNGVTLWVSEHTFTTLLAKNDGAALTIDEFSAPAANTSQVSKVVKVFVDDIEAFRDQSRVLLNAFVAMLHNCVYFVILGLFSLLLLEYLALI